MLYERAASARLRRARKRENQSVGTRIEIEVADAAEGGSVVVECLWRRGIPASLLERAGSWAVEVRSAREEQQRLLGEVAAALEPWLVATRWAGLALRLGERQYTLRPGLGLLDQRGGPGMMAAVGDRIVVESERAGRQGRAGVIEEILSGNPPRYRVRWDDGIRARWPQPPARSGSKGRRSARERRRAA